MMKFSFLSNEETNQRKPNHTAKEAMRYDDLLVPKRCAVFYLKGLGEDQDNRRIYAKRSILLFSEQNPVRLQVIELVNNSFFDSFILIAIFFNSIAMGLGDYGHIYDDPDSNRYMELRTAGSWRNKVLTITNNVCTFIFAAECLLKIIAMGLVGTEHTYLRDGWNALDFIVVVSGILESSFESVPNMSALRAFRALRPLRSVNRIGGVSKIARSMVSAVPRLINVIGILVFVLTIFSILGLQLYSGKLHMRCRLTPFPVAIDWTSGDDPNEFACLEGRADANFNMNEDNPTWTKQSSPWNTARKCWWPIDDENTRVCTFPRQSGYKCPRVLDDDGIYLVQTYCGSNFDARGNIRFQGMVMNEQRLTKEKMKWHPVYNEDRNWGCSYSSLISQLLLKSQLTCLLHSKTDTLFDNFGDSFLSIFQSITLEGWTPIMYMCQDAMGSTIGGIFFSLLVSIVLE